MPRARWWVCLSALILLSTAPANAGTIAFSSARCADENDRQTRPDMTFPHVPPGCATAIWLVEDDGTGLRRITTPQPFKGHSAPTWSPDGARIAYAGEGAIWVARADGSDPRRITEGESAGWSPDGLSVVVSRDTTTHGAYGTVPGSRDLFAVTLNGLVTRRLTHTPEDEIDPRLSYDGTKVVFTRGVSGYQYMPYWKRGQPPTLPPEILAREGVFSLDLVGGREARLLSTDIPLNTQFGARFSPDGKRLAFSADWSIHTMNADGSGLRRWTAPQTGFQPAWSGAHSFIFIQRDGRGSGLVELELAANKFRTILPMDLHGPHAADWASPGGVAALDPPADVAAPGLGLYDASLKRRVGTRKRPPVAAASARRGVRRQDLRYMVADTSGLRVVRVAFGRRGRKRCRFLGRRSYSRPRSCRRPLYRTVGSPRAWGLITARLRPGAHVVYVRTKDAHGNRTRRARSVYLTIRR